MDATGQVQPWGALCCRPMAKSSYGVARHGRPIPDGAVWLQICPHSLMWWGGQIWPPPARSCLRQTDLAWQPPDQKKKKLSATAGLVWPPWARLGRPRGKLSQFHSSRTWPATVDNFFFYMASVVPCLFTVGGTCLGAARFGLPTAQGRVARSVATQPDPGSTGHVWHPADGLG